MSDRASVQFRGPDGELSCVLYGKWGDPGLPEAATEFAKGITPSGWDGVGGMFPLSRLEVDAVIVSFLIWLSERRRLEFLVTRILGACPRIRSWRRKLPRNNLLTAIWTLSWSN